jgi:hypothetical protein
MRVNPQYFTRFITHDDLGFVQEEGEGEAEPSYQEAAGAPVEHVSPLGLEVTWFTTVFLNVGEMIGARIYSTRSFHLHVSEEINSDRTSSGKCVRRRWVGWSKHGILSHWVYHCSVTACCLHGTCKLFPPSIRWRGCVSGASVSTAEVSVDGSFRCSICIGMIHFLVLLILKPQTSFKTLGACIKALLSMLLTRVATLIQIRKCNWWALYLLIKP